jgi:Ser/Thr protein kinase RdoA (MazF antagonist)
MAERNEHLGVAIRGVKLWNGDAHSCREIADTTNRVYSFFESGEKQYLRMISACERTKAQVKAEFDFIFHLYQGGVDVMRPLPSTAGRLIEELEFAGDTYFVSVFGEAKGEAVTFGSPNFNKEYFRLCGRTLGHIHALSKIFIPSTNGQRPAWDEDRLLLNAEAILPVSEKIVRKEYQTLRDRLHRHPRSNDTYGLIHGDFGGSNLRSQDGRLYVFDFDDCCYCWFAYDLAILIYPHGWRKESLQFLDWLLEGYSDVTRSDVAPDDITLFCQWRLVYMFLVYARKWGFENLSAQQAAWFVQKRDNIARGYRWPPRS